MSLHLNRFLPITAPWSLSAPIDLTFASVATRSAPATGIAANRKEHIYPRLINICALSNPRHRQ